MNGFLFPLHLKAQQAGNTSDLTVRQTSLLADVASDSPTESHTPKKEITEMFTSTENQLQPTTDIRNIFLLKDSRRTHPQASIFTNHQRPTSLRQPSSTDKRGHT
ncbi:hypothetical protein L1987_76359 [Smallanthus sonchifolius]|uniref:Uncharacterized protein n=1 Tax=Smallanthus sonchifolius TaxID=185202 RepID=A0ACB9A8H3_9ASTR|nr:hypothetical protein L1987_76359 [Smallanthus sonchifolius]